jgi:hypothetical protein
MILSRSLIVEASCLRSVFGATYTTGVYSAEAELRVGVPLIRSLTVES